MTSTIETPGKARAAISKRHLRTDNWWLTPLLTFLGLAGFLIYATVRIFVDGFYWSPAESYLAPFYSPCLATTCVEGSSHFLGQPFSVPSWVSPAMIILILPGGFRATCYYYRKSYYRSFWVSPPACAVPDGHKKYTGETRFPLIFQNVHRYFFYAAILVGAVLTYDAGLAFFNADGEFRVGLGTVILVLNAIAIWAYTLGCHSCRNIIGGRLTHFSKHPIRYWLWTQVSKLNKRHQFWAWVSMFSVVIADAYVWMVAAGVFTDPSFIN